MAQDFSGTDYFCLTDKGNKRLNVFQCFTSFMKSFIVKFCEDR